MTTPAYVKDSLGDMDERLKKMHYQAYGCLCRQDDERLQDLCWEFLKVITWRKVAPYCAEALTTYQTCVDDVTTDATFIDVVQDAVALWFENQPKVTRELIRQSYDGRHQCVTVEFRFTS